MLVLTFLLLSTPHLMRALMFVVQVSHAYCNHLKARFPGSQTQFHICLPSLYFHPLRHFNRSQSLLPKIQANGETIIIVDFPEWRVAFAGRGNSWKTDQTLLATGWQNSKKILSTGQIY